MGNLCDSSPVSGMDSGTDSAKGSSSGSGYS